MANPEHLAKLKEGVESWNAWRQESSKLVPDLTGANLSHAKLFGADLRRANLSHVDMYCADLSGASLFSANLRKANLSGAKLRDADLGRVNMRYGKLFNTDLTRANLRKAYLVHVDLSGANLSHAKLFGADLRRANLTKSTLESADLRSVNLQRANFDRATLTNAHLWETLRADWSIKAVICERAYWDEDANDPTEYAPGEFERLHSQQTSIELFYKGGISTFELNTLPALLQHLASKHPDANIQLKTIEQTGGGAKITISLGDANKETKQAIQTDAAQVQQIQLSLRESEGKRLQLEANFNRILETFTSALLASAPSQIHFHAPVHTAALPSGNATVELHQTFNDTTELIQLIDKLLTHNAELTAPQSAEIEATKAELQKPNPDKSLLTRSLVFLKTLPKEAILKGAGKLGEKAADANWSNLLHQLGEFIHHLH